MNIAKIFKSGLLVISILGGFAFNKLTNKQYTEQEIKERIEKRIEIMRKAVDGVHGEGFFDRVASGKVTKEELERSGISLFHISNADSYTD